MKYLPTIGLEVHVQLRTASKMFCGCRTGFGAPPNRQVCPVCLGYPGAMPTINGEAIRYTVLAGLMLGSRINETSKFDRKSYFYPDMPKNYQISQYDKPLCIGGSVPIQVDGIAKSIGITRIHLEEDVGKSMHFVSSSGVDFNRAGIPLMEIVTDPEMVSPEEAFAFLCALKQIIQYAEVSDCNLEQGNIRCDVNCSVRPEGQKELGTKTEIKNLNTFKGVLSASRYEIQRQVDVLQGGGSIIQETRRWDIDTGVTSSMRSKEEAHDYRYFPEPDLLPVIISAEQVEGWKKSLPELPQQRCDRFVRQYGIPVYDARVLVADKSVADYFEQACRSSSKFKAVSNWIMTEILGFLTETGSGAGDIKVRPDTLAELVELVDSKIINATTAKEVLGIMFEQGGRPGDIVKARGLVQMSDSGEIEALVDEALKGNPKSVADFAKGKTAALQFLVGQVMRLSKGKANVETVQRLLQSKLSR